MTIEEQLVELNAKIRVLVPDTKKISLHDYLILWLYTYKNGIVKPSTLDKYQRLINQFFTNTTLSTVDINDIDGLALQQFLMNISAERQREHVYTLLRDSFRKALALRYITYNPLLSVKIPKHQPSPSKALTAVEERVFLSSCATDKYALVYYIMLYSGLRKGEVMALEWRDIDIANRVINVTKSLSYKGAVTTPKTLTSFREVPIFDNLYNLLKFENNEPSARIFYINGRTMDEHLTAIRERAQLPFVTNHTLRHTFATRCIERNVPPKILQRWLGHSTIAMTMNLYVHVNNEYERAEISRYNSIVAH